MLLIAAVIQVIVGWAFPQCSDLATNAISIWQPLLTGLLTNIILNSCLMPAMPSAVLTKDA
jgi:hypothetical protein